MDALVIALAAFVASGLTLVSGFGLGTLLMPVVALFFPVQVAVGITAVVHLLNNLFKLALVGARAERGVVVRFGVPAIAAAFLGALLLGWLSGLAPLAEYRLGERALRVEPVKLILGVVILVVTLLELTPRFSRLRIDPRYLPFGGLLSGFFGGLSGHQGAFRSMFLLKLGLTPERFIATGVVIAVLVDLARLAVYGVESRALPAGVDWRLVAIATASAFAGAYLGSRLIRKLTLRAVQLVVSVLLCVVALGLIGGLV